MSEKGPEADIRPRRFNVADVPIADIRDWGTDRGKGQKKVTVGHLHVHENGGAIVRNVEQGRKTAEPAQSTRTSIVFSLHSAWFWQSSAR